MKSQVAETVDQECVGSALGGFGQHLAEDLSDQGAREVADLLLDLWGQALGGVFQLGGGDRVEQHLREDFERGPSVAAHAARMRLQSESKSQASHMRHIRLTQRPQFEQSATICISPAWMFRQG